MHTNHAEMVRALAKSSGEIIKDMTPENAHILHMAVGICGEAGELIDAVKKAAIYAKPLDRVNVIEELGDLEFYMEGMRDKLGITREETIQANIDKLNKRYHEGAFSNDQAQERADKADPSAVSVLLEHNRIEELERLWNEQGYRGTVPNGYQMHYDNAKRRFVLSKIDSSDPFLKVRLRTEGAPFPAIRIEERDFTDAHPSMRHVPNVTYDPIAKTAKTSDSLIAHVGDWLVILDDAKVKVFLNAHITKCEFVK